MGSFSPLALGWCLHAFFGIVTFVGGILFIMWAMKLKQDELKKWVVGLLIAGILGSLLTSSYSFLGWKSMLMNGGMTNEMMEGMMKGGSGMMQNR